MTGQDSQLKILLVDDEMLVRAGTAMMLDELGHDVTEAASAQAALDILSTERSFDVMLSDYRMPDMDGAALIARVKEHAPGIRAVLMTGYEADDPRLAGLDCAMLAKPFGLDALESILSADS